MDDNLGTNIMFMLEAIIATEIDETDIETIEAALILSHFAWNTEIKENSIKPEYYKTELKKLEKANPTFWEQLISNNSEELIDILRKRKRVFFSNDNRLIKTCFINTLETVSVEEDNSKSTLHVGR